MGCNRIDGDRTGYACIETGSSTGDNINKFFTAIRLNGYPLEAVIGCSAAVSLVFVNRQFTGTICFPVYSCPLSDISSGIFINYGNLERTTNTCCSKTKTCAAGNGCTGCFVTGCNQNIIIGADFCRLVNVEIGRASCRERVFEPV